VFYVPSFLPQSFIALLALAVVVLADNPPPPPPPYKPAPAPYKPEPKYEEGPAQYEYAYAVKDEYANLDFNANEERDGYKTTGSYEVLLPDGRTQTVTYTVDGYSGYVADVQYAGEAKYEPYHPKPAPKYPPPPPKYN
jgi:Insect cuticle protein.